MWDGDEMHPRPGPIFGALIPANPALAQTSLRGRKREREREREREGERKKHCKVRTVQCSSVHHQYLPHQQVGIFEMAHSSANPKFRSRGMIISPFAPCPSPPRIVLYLNDYHYYLSFPMATR
jgi:hypothetical protein